MYAMVARIHSTFRSHDLVAAAGVKHRGGGDAHAQVVVVVADRVESNRAHRNEYIAASLS